MSYKFKLACVGLAIMCWPIPYYSLYKITSQNAHTEAVDPILKSIQELCNDKYIGEVIARSKYPIELAVIAKIESDCRPQIRGDNNNAYGLYQIQEKHWQQFSSDLESQTRKAEYVYESLKRQHGTERAFERYNGSGRDARRYAVKAKRIQKELLDKIAFLGHNEIKRENIYGETQTKN